MESLKKHINDKKVLYIVIAIVVVAMAAVFIVYRQTQLASSQYNAEVSLVSGSVERSEAEGIWQELKSGDNVSEGDIVRVNGEGKAVITVDDGSAIRLDSDTKIILVSLNPSNVEIDNEIGEVYTRVVKADRPFVVRVDDESYKALGTAYKTVNSDNEKGVYVYESKVEVTGENVEVNQGEKFFKYNQDSSLVGKVSDITSDEIAKDEFAIWNSEKDKESNEFSKYMGVLDDADFQKVIEAEKETESNTGDDTENQEQNSNQNTNQNTGGTGTSTVSGSISLSASQTESGVSLVWTIAGVSASNGFKVVKSLEANPSYPGDSAVYLGSDSRSYNWNLSDGKTYHFRVCQYTGSGCGIYSNDVAVQSPSVEDGVVNGIVLSSGGGATVNWTVDGYSDRGFKVVWSKTPGATYPNRAGDAYHYYSSPEVRTDNVTDFSGNGDYYVRVCEYLGGACGVYSNEIMVTLE